MIQNCPVVETRLTLSIVLATILAAGVVAGCAGGDAFLPGESEVPRAAPDEHPPAPPPPPAKWELASALPSLKVLQDTYPSRGHGVGDLRARLLANDTAAAAFDKLIRGDHMPQGSVLVSQQARRADGTPDGLFVMVKREPGFFPAGGDWEWVAVGPDNRIRARGQLAPCARCHADAAVDFVFPRPVPQP